MSFDVLPYGFGDPSSSVNGFSSKRFEGFKEILFSIFPEFGFVLESVNACAILMIEPVALQAKFRWVANDYFFSVTLQEIFKK